MRLLVLLLFAFVPLLCAQQSDAEGDEQDSTESTEFPFRVRGFHSEPNRPPPQDLLSVKKAVS